MELVLSGKKIEFSPTCAEVRNMWYDSHGKKKTIVVDQTSNKRDTSQSGEIESTVFEQQ